MNLLILQREGLLDLPVLYLSRYITSTKPEYYRLLQSTGDSGRGGVWGIFLAKGGALTRGTRMGWVKTLGDLMQHTRQRLQAELPKIYSQELLNNLFRYPYTKIEFVERDLGISRITAARHLDLLADKGFVRKQKIGRTNFYINQPLFELLSKITLPHE